MKCKIFTDLTFVTGVLAYIFFLNHEKPSGVILISVLITTESFEPEIIDFSRHHGFLLKKNECVGVFSKVIHIQHEIMNLE